MNFTAIALAIGATLFSHTATIRVGKWRVSATDVGGNPVHFNFSAALVGIEQALVTNGPWTGQSGDIKITIDLWPTT